VRTIREKAMPWVRIDDGFPQHPKVIGVGPLGLALQVAGLCYCNRYLTDGFVPKAAVPLLLDFSEIDTLLPLEVGEPGTWHWALQKLMDAGLWKEVPDGYILHDYLDYQPSKEQVLKEREVNKARQERFRGKPIRNAVSNASVTPLVTDVSQEHNAVTEPPQICNAVSNAAPNPNPIPNPNPVPESKKEEKGGKPPKKTRVTEITPEFIETMKAKWSMLSDIEDRIAEALAHKSANNSTDKRAYLNGWLRRDAERWPGKNNNHPSRGQLPTDPSVYGRIKDAASW
jgi:hypothetical protein